MNGESVEHRMLLMQRVQTRAIMSLLDVVEEIAHEVGDAEWAQLVTDVVEEHRRELRTGEVEGPPRAR